MIIIVKRRCLFFLFFLQMEPRNRNGRLPPLPGSPTLAEFHRTPTSCRASEHDLSRLRAPRCVPRLVSLCLDVISLSAVSFPRASKHGRNLSRVSSVAHGPGEYPRFFYLFLSFLSFIGILENLIFQSLGKWREKRTGTVLFKGSFDRVYKCIQFGEY